MSTLKVLPQITAFSFGEEEVNFDEAVTAVCTITKGDQPIKIWWSLSESDLGIDRNLSSSDGVMITRNSQKISMLAIESVKARHRGNYTCFASNKAGITQHSAFLAVNGTSLKYFKRVISLNLERWRFLVFFDHFSANVLN